MIGEPRKHRFAVAKAKVGSPSPGDAVVLPKDLGEVWHSHARRDALDLCSILAQGRLAREGKDILLARRAVPLATQRVAQEREALIDMGNLGFLRREGERYMLVQKGRNLGRDLFKLRFGPIPQEEPIIRVTDRNDPTADGGASPPSAGSFALVRQVRGRDIARLSPGVKLM
jgi:hypothetical protein